ncbi:adenylate/guanylate cyclase domain-containing protein [Glycomyces salinus]|uniref:adenylate/guanylate cyclase domain-containing protein n=1 Tax=Glycomyces salinus TaxID=980294 RepID=UPI0018EBD8E4|nr:adenylate/guanylate cyclase domain-containing protein [Glycomyces salinus]
MDTASIPQQHTTTRNLVIMAVDIRKFSSYTDTQRNEVAVAFRDAIEESFTRTDLGEVWAAKVFEQNTGDGIVAGFDEAHLRDIVDRIPVALQGQLRELHHRNRLNVRMRMGISVGPVKALDDDRIDIAPNQPIIDAVRIADCLPNRVLLDKSDPEATFLSLAVSPRVISDVIGPDPLWVRDSEFVRVSVFIEEKDYTTNAFVHVPTPSGDLLRFGLANLPGSEETDAASPGEHLEDRLLKAERLSRSDSAATGGQNVGIGDVSGDARAQNLRTGNVAESAAIAGGDVRQDDHSQNHSGQDRSTTNIGRDSITAEGDATVNNVGRDQNNARGDGRAPFWNRGEGA